MTVEIKKRTRRKAERPTEILDAAFEEFVKTGYSATRLEDVAKRAGVTKGTIYFYFETKERVFQEMMRHKSQALLPDLDRLAGQFEGSYAERFRRLLVFFFGRIAEDREEREMLRLLIAEGSRFPEMVDKYYDEFVQSVLNHFKQVIAAGVAAGEFRAAPAYSFTDVLVSPALLLSIWTILFGTRRPIDITAFTEASIDLLMNGIKSPSSDIG
jgi:AcrR family transcriptional regulator